MLISWIVLAMGQLSAAGLPLIDVTGAAPRQTATPIVPGEPSTFVEALIGAAFIAAYLVLARRVRCRRTVRKLTTPARPGSGRKAA